MSQLHTDVAKLAGTRAAMVLNAGLIERILLSELRRSASGLVGASMDTRHEHVVAVFESISTNPTDLKLGVWSKADDVTLSSDVGPEFDFTLRLAFAGNTDLTFCHVRYAVKALAVKVKGEAPGLQFSFSFEDVTAKVDAYSNERAAAVAASGIDADDLLRVEGAFTYGMGDRLLSSALGKPRDVDLQQLFPALSFSGKLELHLTEKCIVVVPEQLSILSAVECPPTNPLDGAALTVSTPDAAGQFTLTGVVPPARRPAIQADPAIALYAPKPLLDQRFGGAAAPAIAHEDVGTGFIGHVLHVTAAVKGVTVSIQSGALELSLSIAVWGSASVNVDVPCVGRKEFGRVDFRVPDEGDAVLSVSLRGGLDTSLRAILTSELKGLDLGKPYVNFSLFGGLKPGLIATVTSYIVDYVIGLIIRNNLPWMVFDAIKEALENKFFVIADLKELVPDFQQQQLPNFATHSGVADSALMGAAYKPTT